MIYFNPATVLSPRDCIDQVQVLYDVGIVNNIYSLAIVTWEGVDRIGIRWNVNQREWDDPAKVAGTVTCVGEPNSRGYPTWFILPDQFLADLVSGSTEVAEIVREALKKLEQNEG